MADTLESLEIEVVHSSTNAAGEINSVADALSNLKKQLSDVLPDLKSLAENLAKVGKSKGKSFAQKATEKLETPDKGFLDNLREVADTTGIDKVVDTVKDGIEGISEGLKDAKPLSEGMQMLISGMTKYGVLTEKTAIAEGRMQDAFKRGDFEGAIRAREQMLNAIAKEQAELAKITPKPEKAEETATALEEVEDAAKGAAKGAEELAKATKKTENPLSNFLASLKRIAFYRIVRSIIKSITQAFTEGLEKAYLFSQGMGDDANRFAQALDLMKGKTNQMKGQLGSAFAALLTAIQPILETIINIVIRVADAISQLFAAFTGKTYLKASATATKFSDAMKGGAKAAKEWKNQLLGFDEINRLNEPSNGGGGGGSSALDGYDMQPAQISEFWLKTAETLRPIIDGIKLQFEGLGDVVFGILTGDWDRACQGAVKILLGFKESVHGILDLIRGVYDSFSLLVQERVDSLLTWIEGKTGLDLSLVKDDWNDFCEESRKLVDGWVEDLKGLFDGLGEFLTGIFLGDWDIMGQGIVGIFSAVFSAVERTAVTAINWVISKINDVLDMINFFTGENWHINLLNASGFGGVNASAGIAAGAAGAIGRFASGGFPAEGQLFFASERGAEMIGSMDGRTAVANNESIVEGIRQGVYDAVMAANSNRGDGTPFKLFLDSREIKYGLQQLDRAWG